MILDWLFREGWIIFTWWLISSAMALTVLPLLVRLLPALPDRGYSLARPAGLLLIAFTFWMLGVMGFLNNSAGSIIVSWILVLTLSMIAYWNIRTAFNWRDWWQQNRRHIITTEVVFAILLVGFSIFRAYQNGLSGTEKPMDLAFMTAIQHSENFPPNDPWLSGYIISYYYFGYLMAALNATLAGVAGTIGYNMHLALLFALTGITTFGVITNLIRAHARDENSRSHKPALGIGFGLLGMTFLLLMSNFNMLFVELPYRHADFDNAYYQFWDTKSRAEAPTEASRANVFWWWFDHARTITERTPELNLQAGQFYRGEQLSTALTVPSQRIHEVIDEFPAFSFLLGDSHPHVMALPFVLLALGLAVNVLFSATAPSLLQTLLYGVGIGSLIFLNTWDAPVYLIVILGAEAIRRIVKNRATQSQLDANDVLELIAFGGALVVIALIAYSPFLIGFTSQIGGILPNVLYPTRPQQMFLMFAPFLLLLGVYLLVEVWRGRNRMNWFLGIGLATGVLIVWVGVMVILVAANITDSSYSLLLQDLTSPDGVQWGVVNQAVFGRRIATLPTLIVMLGALTLAFARIYPKAQPANNESDVSVLPYPLATGFAILLIICGVGLVFIPEFAYLRDNFNSRMNTVFKFYYQAWVLFSIASAYGVYSIIADVTQRQLASVGRIAYSGLTVFVLAAGLLYFPMGAYYRMWVETGIQNNPTATLTLDGGLAFGIPQQDYDAIMCLQNIVGRNQVVVAEAMPLGSYNSSYGRVGALTGIPIVMGWRGHQEQWRGTSFWQVVGSRPQDLDMLFTATRLDLVQSVLDRYDIDYIIYGATERQIYGNDGETKFLDNYPIVCEAQTGFGTTRIYRVSRPAVPLYNNGQ